MADKVHDLYVTNQVGAYTNHHVHAVSLDFWHKRLGHPSNKSILSIKDQL